VVQSLVLQELIFYATLLRQNTFHFLMSMM